MTTKKTAEERLEVDPFQKKDPWVMKYVTVQPASRPDVFNILDWISAGSEVTFEGDSGGNPESVYFKNKNESLALSAIGGGIARILYAQSVIRRNGVSYVTSWRFTARALVGEEKIEVSIKARTMPGGAPSPDGDGLTGPK